MIYLLSWDLERPATREEIDAMCVQIERRVEREKLEHQLQTVNLAILRFCVIHGLTLEKAMAIAKENAMISHIREAMLVGLVAGVLLVFALFVYYGGPQP